MEDREGQFLYHVFVNLLARTYGIDGLVAYSVEKLAALAETLRHEETLTFHTLMKQIVQYEAWSNEDPLKHMAIKQIQAIIKEDEAKENIQGKVLTKWSCDGCGTVFRYMGIVGGKPELLLGKCSNCADGGDETVIDMKGKVKFERQEL